MTNANYKIHKHAVQMALIKPQNIGQEVMKIS